MKKKANICLSGAVNILQLCIAGTRTAVYEGKGPPLFDANSIAKETTSPKI